MFLTDEANLLSYILPPCFDNVLQCRLFSDKNLYVAIEGEVEEAKSLDQHSLDLGKAGGYYTFA